MGDYITCRSCTSPYCKGCNLKRLEMMLENGKFDGLMNGNRAIITSTDVSPVRHGKWVKIYEDGEPAIEQHQVGIFCSRCNKMPKDRFTESEFCPHCGAKMGGKYEPQY